MRAHNFQESIPARQGAAARAARSGKIMRWVAALSGLAAVSLLAASALHLSGQVTGRSAPFDADHAGVAEALIGIVLAGGAVALWRAGARARTAALSAIGFAVLGFCWGLSITARGGHWPDIAYHLSVLPLLVGSFVALLRAGPRPGRFAAGNDRPARPAFQPPDADLDGPR